MDKNSFFSLLDKYRDGTATDAEKALVEAYYRRLEMAGSTELSPEEEAALKEGLYKKITDNIKEEDIKIIPLKRKNYSLVAAAAAVVITVGAGGYFWLAGKSAKPLPPKPVAAVKPHDLPPGRDAAVLTLADGKKIVLDSASGAISQQGNVTVLNVNGKLSYAPTTKGNENEVVYNTVSTARGNQYQLILSDGTKVWLNSASSLRFPASFTGNSRDVELDGEGYFEVVKNAAKPFHVKTRTQDIEVLGTHFNVNAYKDEETIKTTLLEGSVRVKSEAGSQKSDETSVILKPGQQAVFSPSIPEASIHITSDIDIDQVMAWKNGWFEFENTDLKTIMRQISRWYDVDIEYQIKTGNERYGGRISRNLNLSSILKMLESYGVQFRLEGKKLVVQ